MLVKARSWYTYCDNIIKNSNWYNHNNVKEILSPGNSCPIRETNTEAKLFNWVWLELWRLYSSGVKELLLLLPVLILQTSPIPFPPISFLDPVTYPTAYQHLLKREDWFVFEKHFIYSFSTQSISGPLHRWDKVWTQEGDVPNLS